MATYRRKRTYRRPASANQKATKALALVKKVQRKSELKMFPYSISTTANYSNGISYPLHLMGQGSTNSTRIGNVISPTSIVVKPNWSLINPTTTSFRMILFQWKTGLPAALTATDILEAASLSAFKSEANRYQSSILYDKTFYRENYDVTRFPVMIKRKLKGIMAYNDSGGLDATKNGIYLCILANTTSVIPMEIQTRLYYRDD